MTPEIIIAIISGFLGVGALGGAIGSVLVSRFSKTKPQRDVDLSKDYLGIVGLTAEQLREMIAENGKIVTEMGQLARQNLRLESDIINLNNKNTTQANEIQTMHAQLISQQDQLNKDARDRDELRQKLSGLTLHNRVLWQYLIAWMEHAVAHKVTPLDPPKELQSDPEIMRILGRKKDA